MARAEIIAELAQGFEGEPYLAELLVRGAVAAGVDAVKLQLIYADEIATPGYKYYELYKRLEMPFEVWQRVRDCTRAEGLPFYLDVSGERSVVEAARLQVDGVKISTSNFFNVLLVEEALARFARVFIGIGGITVAEMDEFIGRHLTRTTATVCFLYGLQAEPTPVEATNLRKLASLRARFPAHDFGYMDHAEGGTDEAMTLALLALPMGVACIEKHLTLDRSIRLEDHVSALTPGEMRTFVSRVRKCEAALGSPSLELTAEERAYRETKVKIVIASRDLRAGSAIAEPDIVLRRIGTATCADAIHLAQDVVGRLLVHDVAAGDPITPASLA